MRYYELTESEVLTPLAKKVARKLQQWESEKKISSNDDYKSQQREDLIKGVALIKRDCQPYLSQVQDPMALRRGVSRDYDADETGRPIFNKKKAHLTDRRPKANSEYHKFVNKYFTSEFGYPFRNAIMTVADQMHSSMFGIDSAVFPIGQFMFLWSSQIKDLNHNVQSMADARGFSALPDIKFADKEEEALYNGLKNANYQTTDLQAAIESKNEIMIWCKEYYTLDNNSDRMLVKSLLK